MPSRDGDHRVGGLERRRARTSSTARSRRRAARPSTAAAARGCARSPRAGCRRELGQVAAEVRVPGVAVDEVGALGAGGHRQVDRHRAQRGQRAARRPASASHGWWRDGAGARSAPQQCTSTSTSAAQLAREVLDVHAGAAVDLGRVLAREQRDPHAQHRPSGPCGSRRCRRRRREALAVGVRGRRRSARPRAMRTFLSTIARRTTALRPTSTPCISTESSTSRVGVHVDARREDRAAHACRRRRSRRRTPSSRARCRVRPSSSNTNLAGGSGSGQVWIGHSWL